LEVNVIDGDCSLFDCRRCWFPFPRATEAIAVAAPSLSRRTARSRYSRFAVLQRPGTRIQGVGWSGRYSGSCAGRPRPQHSDPDLRLAPGARVVIMLKLARTPRRPPSIGCGPDPYSIEKGSTRDLCREVSVVIETEDGENGQDKGAGAAGCACMFVVLGVGNSCTGDLARWSGARRHYSSKLRNENGYPRESCAQESAGGESRSTCLPVNVKRFPSVPRGQGCDDEEETSRGAAREHGCPGKCNKKITTFAGSERQPAIDAKLCQQCPQKQNTSKIASFLSRLCDSRTIIGSLKRSY